MEVKFIQASTIKTSDKLITDIPEGYHVKKIKRKYYLIKTTTLEMDYPLIDKTKQHGKDSKCKK